MGRAVRAGATVIALADRTTIDGIDGARRALPAELTLIPAVTVPCAVMVADQERTLELRGYLINVEDRPLLDLLADARRHREQRAQKMVSYLGAEYPVLTWHRVAQLAPGGVPGRPHIARALVQTGLVTSLREAYSPQWLGNGGRYFEPKRQPPADQVLAVIRAAGGVPILARPRRRHHVQLTVSQLATLQAAGLAGLEVDHPSNPRPAREALRRIAAHLDLIVTGGSGSRGQLTSNAIPIGAGTTSRAMYERLLTAASGTQPNAPRR
ncbi:PHP domain-containing protein [Candidatus Frankia nodulisporulans]|uniref:PHP domain-containing protein n=1 Tax=Candidatus Frankia nodulisporulans TaxID=2060052 RepID=UPI0013CF9D21|nr:PHP domain-containing protein [Candidatus Frankia nodulisporulans]